MKKAKRVVSMLMVFVMLLGVCGTSVVQTQAATLTTAQVKAKIKETKAQISKLKKQKKAEEKKYKQQTAGTKAIIGTVRSTNPYIINDMFGGSYYWVENPKNMTRLITTASGYVKLTGQYRTWNDVTCAVGKAVKVTANPKKIQTKIDKKEDQLEKYQKALKEKVILEDWEYLVGGTGELDYGWQYSGAYNKITWKSSDPSVVSIDKHGVITTKKPGTATISATASVSGKTTKCQISVVELEVILSQTQLTLGVQERATLQCGVNIEWFEAQSIEWESSDPAVVEVWKDSYEAGKAILCGVGEGSCDITVTLDGFYQQTCHVTVTKAAEPAPGISYDQNYDNSYNDSYDNNYDNGYNDSYNYDDEYYND